MSNIPPDARRLGEVKVEDTRGPYVIPDGTVVEEGRPVPEDDPSMASPVATFRPYPDDYLEVTEGDDGDWYWRRKAANHQVISHGEGYEAGGSKTASLETRARGAVRGALRANPDLTEDDIRLIDPTVDEAPTEE